MSTSASQARLKDAHRQLLEACARARLSWQDEAAERFMADVIEPLEIRVRAAMTAMAEFGDAMGAAKRDLKDETEDF